MIDTAQLADDLPQPVFLGFRAQLPCPDSGDSWEGAAEVCSTSGCMAKHPATWFDDLCAPPELNRAACTETEAEARDRVPAAERSEYRIYAYRVIPALFGKASPTPETVAADALFPAYSYLADLPPEPDLSGLDRLGFDVVQYSNAINWGCSPLSCNYQHQHHRVNRYCLVDTLAAAVAAARAFGQNEPEPGPYIIVQVFRVRE